MLITKTSQFSAVVILILFACEVRVGESLFTRSEAPEEANLNFTELASRYGRRVVEYEVITEDGYILSLYRIPGTSKYPVLLMHGFLDTSDTWLIRGDNSLGITLANDNFDLWFGNSRGNRYSRRHTHLNPDTHASYWKWSFHHLGYYDLPATIDKILHETGAANLTAIGHSRGNTMFYVLGSLRKEYNSKINVLIALAPICYFSGIRPPLSTLMESFSAIEKLFTALRIEVTDVFNYNSIYTRFIRGFCTKSKLYNMLCLNLLFFSIVGFDVEELEPSFLNVVLYHFPAGNAWMDFLHFGQIRTTGVFAPFDYGNPQNLEVYKSSTPPAYDLTNVTMPIALLAARNDRLSTLPDVDILKRQLPNVVDYTVNRRLTFNHVDDVWGRRMRDYLFPDIYRVLLKYNSVGNNHRLAVRY